MHRGASCAKMVENYQDARWPRSAQGVMPLKVIAVLMPFEIEPLIRSAGFSVRTVNRAKQDIDVKSIREGFGKDSVCFWSLPDACNVG